MIINEIFRIVFLLFTYELNTDQYLLNLLFRCLNRNHNSLYNHMEEIVILEKCNFDSML